KFCVFTYRRIASICLLLLISKYVILCIYLVFRILALSRRLNASNLFLSLILHLGNLFLMVQLHFSKLFLILKSGVNHTSRGSISKIGRAVQQECRSPTSYAVFCLKKTNSPMTMMTATGIQTPYHDS